MAEQEAQSEIKLESGTYEIVRNRLANHGNELRSRLDKLNAARKKIFGSIETKLIATDRVTTEHNCVARDMVPIGSLFLFGYNVNLGLKTEIELSDVFSVYNYSDHTFHVQNNDLITDTTFIHDFKNLYKYYRESKFAKFALIDKNLFMIFQVGKSITDIKTFKWVISGDKLVYAGNRGDSEFVYPDQHEFLWTKTGREQQRKGIHPHVSIEDKVFVETVGGDLTIKIEDNTESGQGVFSEPVKNKDQTLDDSEIFYALVGNLVVLKIRPYQENEYRYIVYNEKIQTALRIDALEDSCVLLPDDQGIIFSRGYYLQTGEFKLFENQQENMLFEKRITSPNGEDFLYVFYNRNSGLYNLLKYNIIEQKVETPILCHGFSIFDNGELCQFRSDEGARKHHSIQIWQTPFLCHDLLQPITNDSFIFKIGNKDIVRAMAESNEIISLLNKGDSYSNLYVDLVRRTVDIIDSYHWLNNKEVYNLNEPLSEIKQSASSAIEEFEKVLRIKKNTREEVKRVSEKATKLIHELKVQKPQIIDDFVKLVSQVRIIRGEIISLKELRYVDLTTVEEYENSIVTLGEDFSQMCVKFLLQDTALNSYEKAVGKLKEEVEKLEKVAEANKLEKQITAISQELEMLIETVSNLKIEDVTQKTSIIDNISVVYSSFNQITAALKNRRKTLSGQEGRAEFNAQVKLLGQSISNYLDICETPEKCDEYLTKLMVQIEELEGKFSDFDEFIEAISIKREEVYNAFESKKLNLQEVRNKRSGAIHQSASRIINGIKNRITEFKTVSEINGYFASDLMVDKVRDIVKQLIEMGDSVKADDIQSKLKTAREESVRQLSDRSELFKDGDNVISLGKHKFLVNTQPFDLTMVNRDDEMFFHLTGTNFFEKIVDEEFIKTKDVWDQLLVSENKQVYRGEYLAYNIYKAANSKIAIPGIPTLLDLQKFTDAELLDYIQKNMSQKYSEGYIKGVHDTDVLIILKTLLHFSGAADLLKFSSVSRACAMFYWNVFETEEKKTEWDNRLKGVGLILSVFPETTAFSEIIGELETDISVFLNQTKLFDAFNLNEAAEYLFYERIRGNDFIIDKESASLYNEFILLLKKKDQENNFENSLNSLSNNPIAKFHLAKKWLQAFTEKSNQKNWIDYLDETAVLLITHSFKAEKVINFTLKVELNGFNGSHNLIEEGKYILDYNSFVLRLKRYEGEVVPQFEKSLEVKKRLVQKYREELRLNEFKPSVLTSFVRNQLINQVYLPLIGNNLAKQIGTAGENKRTDLMGMLLIISPPGYGKTTLVEYIANRLGLIYVKINGPALGNSVISLDPEQAPNINAAEELKKLNLALEMGDNIMLYIDDIQHCNPEFLQKFISLCDGQRKIEGVFKGKSKTYDLRGKKVCVVMAGNPYTESGDKFRIPDMLANRADIYNLGDVIGDSLDAFKLSFVENSLTSNPVLSNLAQKSRKDVYAFVKIAETGNREGIDFEAVHSPEEANDYIEILKKMLYARDILLKVNEEYIYSAAQAEEYRVEPQFKLQGSYRNMNKVAEKLMPVMNEQELKTMILSHYENESQTLTTGAEANMLKFKDMFGFVSTTEKARWEEIKETFRRNHKLKGVGGDNQTAQVLLQMESISQNLFGIKSAIKGGEKEK
ncbi:MAG: DNA repair ATPase [Bacteroidota bacterium]|nr:DNA repair ATPase [Bacteroidota bacterium]